MKQRVKMMWTAEIQFKWKYDLRNGNCNFLSNCKSTQKLQLPWLRRSYLHCKVETRFTDTRLIRTRRYYGQFSLSLGKVLTFSLNSTRFTIGTPVNAENGHIFLTQTTNFHRKPTSLMRTLRNQLCAVIDLSSLNVKHPSVDSMSMFPALQY